MHNTLWGSEKSDKNGQVVLNGGNLLCLDCGRKTRVDVRISKESVLDQDCPKMWQGGTVYEEGSVHRPLTIIK